MADTTAFENLPATTGARAETVQARVREGREAGFSILNFLAGAGFRIPAWWSPTRDASLRRFWKESDHLSGALYTMIAKMTSIPFQIVPVDPSNPQHVIEAEERSEALRSGAEFGEGWQVFYAKFIEDLLSQDNGAFAEIIGPGNPDGPLTGKPVTLAHLDSYKCQRTGNPEYPVIYRDTDGAQYKIHYTRVLYASQMPSPIAEMFGVGYCLDALSTVWMADGSTRRIRDLVNERSQEMVMSLDDNGDFVPRRITNWYKNPRAGRAMVNIRGNLTRKIRGWRERNSWVTEDHPILTPYGWVHAGDLQDGDEVVTALPHPSSEQMEFIVGSMLGDSSLTKTRSGSHPVLAIGHSLKQSEWFYVKERILESDFGFYNNEYMTPSGHKTIRGATRAHAAFTLLHNQFYNGNIKVIPIDLLAEHISPRLLAAWYLDDGYLKQATPARPNTSPIATIATLAYSREQIQDACDIINSTFGYDARVSVHSIGQYIIRFSSATSETFFRDIAKYVPTSMRYKLPNNGVGYDAYDPTAWDLERAIPLVDSVIVKRKEADPKEKSPVYCIDVEGTHNFVTSGIVIHNCAVSRCINVAQTLIDILVYKMEKLGSRPYRAIIYTKGGLDPDDVGKAFQVAELGNTSAGLSRYSRIPVIGSQTIPEAELGMLELSKLPEGFNEETSLTLGMATIALAFGVDARELFPSLSSGSTRADALLQHLKQRGKGPGQILESMEALINFKYLPSYLKIKFDFQDDAEDQQAADIRHTRAQTRQSDMTSQVLNARTARQQMVADGEITAGQFEQMELEDGRLVNGTSVLSLFYIKTPPYSEVLALGVENPEDTFDNDAEEMFKKIAKQRMVIHEMTAATRNFPKQTILMQCEAALNALQKLYEKPPVIPMTSEEAMQAQMGQAPLPGGGRGALPGVMRDTRQRRTNPAKPNIRNEVNTGTGQGGNVMNKPAPNKNEQDKELAPLEDIPARVNAALARFNAAMTQAEKEVHAVPQNGHAAH